MSDASVFNMLSNQSLIEKRCGLTVFLQVWLQLLLVTVPFHSVLIIPGVSLVKAIGLLLAPIWLIWFMIKTLKKPWRVPRWNAFILFSLWLLICSILLSLLYNPSSPIFSTSFLSILLNVGMAIVTSTTIGSSEKLLQRAYTCLAVGGTFLGISVILQFIAPAEMAKLLGGRIFVGTVEGVHVVRATGVFRDPNYAALALTILACLSLYRALACRRRLAKVLLLSGVFTQVTAVLLTLSRAGYATLALTSLVVLWRERHRVRMWKVGLAGVFGVVLLSTIGGELLDLVVARTKTLGEFAQLLREEPAQARQVDLSLWYRFQVLCAGARMALDKFPFGVGWENFRYRVTEYSDEVPEQDAHNTYVAVVAELGLLGLFALVWLLWLLWKSTGRLCIVAPERLRLFARGARYALFALIIGGLSLTVLHEAVVWALIGLIMAENQILLRATKSRVF